MALARFFPRAYAAVGRHLCVSRQDLEAFLGESMVGVRLGQQCRKFGNARWVAELVVNLLARLYPRMSLLGNDAVCADLSELAQEINPGIEIESAKIAPRLTISLGEKVMRPGCMSAHASGWLVRFFAKRGDLPARGLSNPYSSAAAAGLLCAELFRRVFSDRLEDPAPSPNLALSLLDFGSDAGENIPLEDLSIGHVALVGLGAVGNPAVWALGRHAGLHGDVSLVDHEPLELSNLQRYILAKDKDEGIPKTELAAREFRQNGIAVHQHPMTLEAYADGFEHSFPVPTLCVSVDNVDGRRAAQALLPQLVVNGWTGESGLGASWHRFGGQGPCLCCLYQRGAPKSQTELVAEALGLEHTRVKNLWASGEPISEQDLRVIERHLEVPEGILGGLVGKLVHEVYSGVVCGTVALDVRGLGRAEAVPLAHQSVLAGAFMAAELVKRLSPKLDSHSQREPLVSWDDVRHPIPRLWPRLHAKDPLCICSDDLYQEIYAEKWGQAGASVYARKSKLPRGGPRLVPSTTKRRSTE